MRVRDVVAGHGLFDALKAVFGHDCARVHFKRGDVVADDGVCGYHWRLLVEVLSLRLFAVDLEHTWQDHFIFADWCTDLFLQGWKFFLLLWRGASSSFSQLERRVNAALRAALHSRLRLVQILLTILFIGFCGLLLRLFTFILKLLEHF